MIKDARDEATLGSKIVDVRRANMKRSKVAAPCSLIHALIDIRASPAFANSSHLRNTGCSSDPNPMNKLRHKPPKSLAFCRQAVLRDISFSELLRVAPSLNATQCR